MRYASISVFGFYIAADYLLPIVEAFASEFNFSHCFAVLID